MALEDEFREWEERVVEVPREHRLTLRCPVRQREFVDAPEERIRQGLLYFFVELAKDVRFELGAERERHDVDLRWPTTSQFRPTLPPLLIIETKVDGIADSSATMQLARYLAETAGDCGVVFTGRRMWRLSIGATGKQTVVPLPSLAALADLVRERAEHDPLAAVRADFEAASAGQLDGLRRVVEKYPFATFVLLIGGREIACRNLRISDDMIEYRTVQYSRQTTKVPRLYLERLLRLEA